MTKVTSFWSDFIDLLFPRCCEACRKSLSGSEYLICTSCLLALPRMSETSTLSELSTLKFAGYPQVTGVQAYLSYTRGGITQSLLHALKYKGRQELGHLLGKMYGAELKANSIFPEVNLIVPVPLHPKRLRHRGFNQSQAFAEGLATAFSTPTDPTLLRREVHTSSQTGKTKGARISNVRGIFKIRNGASLRDTAVLLVDDVLTTGATLESCVTTLTENGCRRIHILTIAAAQD